MSVARVFEHRPLGLKPLGLKPLGLKPLGLKPLGLKPLGLKPLGLKPLGLKEEMVKGSPPGCRQRVSGLEPALPKVAPSESR
jgi:hypothetical protein